MARSNEEGPVSAQPSGEVSADDTYRRAKDVCFRQLAVRARSRAELRATLARKEFDPDMIEHVLDRFEVGGFIDDADFAESWVRSRHTHQGLGRRALRAELLHKGVAEEVADEAVRDVDDSAEEERARMLVRKRLRSLAQADETSALRRVIGMLARRGYSEALSYVVAREELGVAREHLL